MSQVRYTPRVEKRIRRLEAMIDLLLEKIEKLESKGK